MSPLVRRGFAGTVWEVAEPDPDRQELWSRELDLPAPAVQVLLNRGLHELDEARRFLLAGPGDIHDPSLLAGMEQAVERLAKAIEAKERIRVYGDYDADGVTSTALLLMFLRGLGANVDFYIPSRLDEGYGLNAAALREARERGIDLVVSVDCGITSLNEARVAEEIGLDLVITDHHEPLDEWPGALAVVNPKRPDCAYPFKGLAGVGVAFKLATALARRFGRPEPGEYLDLVTLGTVADVVPLYGENRALVKAGLPLISQGTRLGLRALLDQAGLSGKPITAESVAFGLAPRINAIGRLGDAGEALALLVSTDWADACARAARLDAENRSRQSLEAAILEQAKRHLAEHPEEAEGPAIVLASPDWHVGVVGIVATRLVELYERPVVLLVQTPDGEARGSARSVRGVNLFEALKACAEATSRFGGHELAAGLGVPPGGLDRFREAFTATVARLSEGVDLTTRVDVDAEIALGATDQRLAQALQRFAPYGAGNPSPLLAARGVEVIEARLVGADSKHLRLKVKQDGRTLEGIAFNLGPALEMTRQGRVDLLFTPQVNEWNGRERLELLVRDLRPAGPGEAAAITATPARPAASAAPATAPWAQPTASTARPALAALCDRRAASDRLAALHEALSEAGPALIAVNNRWTARALEARLALAPGHGRQLVPAKPLGHSGRTYLISSGSGELQAWPAPNGAASAVGPAAAPIAAVTATPAALVLYHPPFSPEHLARLAATAAAAGLDPVRLHLLYGPADIRLSQVILARQAPDRDALVGLYRDLREQAPQGSPVPLRRLFRPAAGPWERERAMVGVTILEELGLLERIMTPDGESLILSIPAPKAKFDLESSDTYRRGRLSGEAFAAYAETALTAAAEVLVAQAFAPDAATGRPEERGATR
ncbi:MAG: single-stranded-DNA-specific exonuclease RecJ [Bacillota bacterium]